jgi:glycosyltransferase involved in cell wall biosynthesis
VGDTPHLLDSGSGILVPPAQPEALAAALTDLLNDPKRRAALGLAARARVQKEYSPQAWTRNLLALYSKLAPSANAALKKLDEAAHA